MNQDQPIDKITGGQVKAILNDLPKTFSKEDFISTSERILNTQNSQGFRFKCFDLLNRIESKGLIKSKFHAQILLGRWIGIGEGERPDNIMVIHFQKV